jgi:hypothetical protein
MVAACAALIIFFFGADVIDASASALPGDNLYSLKRTMEQIDLQLSTNQAARNQMIEHIAEERLFESTLLVLQNKPLDSNFILDTNAAVNMVLQDSPSPAAEAQLATRANYLSQLLKQQNSQLPGMHQLTASLDRLAIS